ncbi:MAG: DUF3429 domain-containing protein [Halothiobacillaceae bacterium]
MNPHHEARLARTAAWLTATGGLPFVLTAALAAYITEPADWIIHALTGYGVVILSFLGGIHWGRGLMAGQPGRLWIAVIPALYAWLVALLAPWPASAWWLAAGFLAMLALDARDTALPAWYRRLRWIITIVVVLVLLGAALAANPL